MIGFLTPNLSSVLAILHGNKSTAGLLQASGCDKNHVDGMSLGDTRSGQKCPLLIICRLLIRLSRERCVGIVKGCGSFFGGAEGDAENRMSPSQVPGNIVVGILGIGPGLRRRAGNTSPWPRIHSLGGSASWSRPWQRIGSAGTSR